MYMKEEAVRGMLTEVRKLCAPGSRILVHFMKYNALEAARYQTARYVLYIFFLFLDSHH